MEAKHLLIVLVISIVLCLVNLILSGLSLAKAGSSKSNYRNIEQKHRGSRSSSYRNPGRSRR